MIRSTHGPVPLSRRFAIAPMMEWTDRHCRYFHRLLTRRALLYTEMLSTGAVLFGDWARLLGFDPVEHPVAVQLGAECVAAMKASVAVPVTVKCRLGIDDQDPEAALDAFAAAVKAAGVDALIVHARKAWLGGLSPKENREVPPLDYGRVYRLKAAHPDLEIIVNGGIAEIGEATRHLARVDGIMMGRAAYREPWRLLAVDPQIFGEPAPAVSPRAALEHLVPYVERALARGERLNAITRHVLGLFRAAPGARGFRRHLAANAVKPGAGAEVLVEALAMVAERDPIHRAAA